MRRLAFRPSHWPSPVRYALLPLLHLLLTTSAPTDFVQRDLADCHTKLGAVDDPNAAQTKGRGAVICEEHYMPSKEEVESRSFNADNQNRFLLRTPPYVVSSSLRSARARSVADSPSFLHTCREGTVVEDPRMRNSWASKATKAILQRWKQSGSAATEREIQAARKQVRILNF
jgi:hypothetical protein